MLDISQFAFILLWIFIVPIRGTPLTEMDPTYGTTSGSKGARWVCPNDRQLALRAKLRTGWSVKSGSFDSRFTDFTYSSSCPGNLNSTSPSASKPCALSDAERSTIIQVIQRAEALDVSEQERVGRLVERLENMKRNVSSVTTTRSSGRSCGSRCSGGNGCVCSCALCGEKFTVLGAGPSLCRDCRKYICQKCGIETSPTYLLTTSGTAGSSSSGSGPGGVAGGVPTPAAQHHQHNVAQHLRLKSPSAANKWFLCRICAETREMWKKSGAWFFKGLPKYVLPEKKDRGRSRAGSRASGWTLTGGTKSLEPPEPDSSSDEEATRRMTRTRSLLSASGEVEVVSPSEQHGGAAAGAAAAATPLGQTSEMRSPQNHPPGGGTRNSTTTSEHERHTSSESNPPEVAASETTIVPQLGYRGRLSSTSSARSIRSSNKSGGTTATSNNGQRSGNNSSVRHRRAVENDRNEEEERESGECSSTSVTQVHPPSAGNSASSNSSSSSATNNTSRKESPGAASESTTSFALVNHQQHHPHHERNRPSRDARMPNLNHPEQLPRIDHMGMVETAAGYGTLEISLRYEPAAQCLQCKVLRARGLRAMDIHGLADPFCKLNILPRTSSATTKLLRTKTVHKTRDPEFNEQLNFYGITESDMKSGRALHVLVQQDDQVARDFLGEARFQLYEVPPYQTRYYNVFLEDHYPVSQEEKIWGEDITNGRGQIQLTLSYSTRRRVLLVTVERAINLLSMDSNGFSDPFVKLSLTKEQQKEDVCPGVVQHHHHHQQQQERQSAFGQSTIVNSVAKKASRKLTISSPRSSASSSSSSNVHSTSVKWKTLNPEWNEEFAFETRLTDLTGLALVMSVWDKDFGKSNDYLGGLTLSCSSKGARLRHWIDMIKYPDHNHRATHNLIEEQIPID